MADGERILLGRIVAAHGIRGDLLVRTYTDAPEAVGSYGPLTDADGRGCMQAPRRPRDGEGRRRARSPALTTATAPKPSPAPTSMPLARNCPPPRKAPSIMQI